MPQIWHPDCRSSRYCSAYRRARGARGNTRRRRRTRADASTKRAHRLPVSCRPLANAGIALLGPKVRNRNDLDRYGEYSARVCNVAEAMQSRLLIRKGLARRRTVCSRASQQSRRRGVDNRTARIGLILWTATSAYCGTSLQQRVLRDRPRSARVARSRFTKRSGGRCTIRPGRQLQLAQLERRAIGASVVDGRSENNPWVPTAV